MYHHKTEDKINSDLKDHSHEFAYYIFNNKCNSYDCVGSLE